MRHDSGDPLQWCYNLMNHYEKLKIDPKTKRAVFSDGLDIPTCIKIDNIFKDQMQLSFGVGTNLTNDVGFNPLNIVIKGTQCNGQPVAKLSDSPGKTMCEDKEFISYLKKVFKIKD